MSKRIVILGAGESGIGTTILTNGRGYDVFVSDGGTIKENYRNDLIDYNIPFEEASIQKKKF